MQDKDALKEFVLEALRTDPEIRKAVVQVVSDGIKSGPVTLASVWGDTVGCPTSELTVTPMYYPREIKQ